MVKKKSLNEGVSKILNFTPNEMVRFKGCASFLKDHNRKQKNIMVAFTTGKILKYGEGLPN